ncbi:MAG: hypothetical protein RRC34_07470, partial [Lentisphaeria bacterium]|nr:hypothetical protein [Lentisphaeria bacterium]
LIQINRIPNKCTGCRTSAADFFVMKKIRTISQILLVFSSVRLSAATELDEDYVASLSRSSSPKIASLVFRLREKIDSKEEIKAGDWEELGRLFVKTESPVLLHQPQTGAWLISPELMVFRRFMEDYLSNPGKNMILVHFLENWAVEDMPGLVLKTRILQQIKKEKEISDLVGDGSWLLRDLLSAVAFEEKFFVWQTENPDEGIAASAARMFDDAEMAEAAMKGEDHVNEKKGYFNKWRSLLAGREFKKAKQYHQEIFKKVNETRGIGDLIFLPLWLSSGKIVDDVVKMLPSEKS